MTENNKPAVPDVGTPEWNGYTLNELYFRRDINTVRQALLAEQITGIYHEIKHRQERKSPFGFVSRIDSIMNFAQYGIMGLTVFSKLKSFLNKIKRR